MTRLEFLLGRERLEATTAVLQRARLADARFWALSSRAGFDKTDPHSGIAWMSAGARPAVSPSPAGFVIVDRSQRPDRSHPMVPRNGEHVERRLQECSLYDPSLDLAVEDADGSVAGYALFWCDDVTGVGMLEPLRVEDHYQRRGLARALLTTGMDRLARRGARRLKVGFESAAARNLYAGAGYRVTASVCDARRRAS